MISLFISLAAFDQTLYRLRYTVSLRPALARAAGFLLRELAPPFENLFRCKFADPGTMKFARYSYRLVAVGEIRKTWILGPRITLQTL